MRGAAIFTRMTKIEDIEKAVEQLSPGVTRRLIAEFAARTRRPPPASSLEELTAREREIVALVGEGLSNGEIAQTLVISEVTVKSHIGRIFTKLDLRDRAAAIVYAFDRGLVAPGG